MKHWLIFFSITLWSGASFAQTVTPKATAPETGDGSSGNPYQIASLENLYWIAADNATVADPLQAERWSSCYILMGDIDALETSSWSGGGWTPIGDATTNFSGTFDGQSHAISGLTINRNDAFQGLFGYTAQTSVIQNLSVLNVNFTNLFGEIGGLAGLNKGTISNCTASGAVEGYYDAGGLVGVQMWGSIIKSYSSVTATGNDAAGGLVGRISGGVISDCYAAGAVAGSTKAGGLIGEAAEECSITNCYSIGAVSGSSFIGGLIGTKSATASITVSNSFWDTQTSGQSSSAAGTGKLTAEMKTQAPFVDAGWSTALWSMDVGINNGYPYLAWQNPSGTPLPVELTSFTAVSNERGALLAWKTATEKNNYGFEVERRRVVDLKSTGVADVWSKVGFVAGNGTSSSAHSYSYMDASVSSGMYAYRLKQIDNDGAYTYSAELEIAMNAPTRYVLGQNYPNPFNPTTVISYQLPVYSTVVLKVYDMLGREAATLVNEAKGAGSHTVTFNASTLSSGAYFYRIQAGSFMQTKKLMLQK